MSILVIKRREPVFAPSAHAVPPDRIHADLDAFELACDFGLYLARRAIFACVGAFMRLLYAVTVLLAVALGTVGCAFYPGFALSESPTLYYLPVAQVANQVACELQFFVDAHKDDYFKDHHWVLARDNIQVVLTLGVDEKGYVNFSGIDAAHLGFGSLAKLISTTTSAGQAVPTLFAKLAVQRSKTAAISFSVSANRLKMNKKDKNDATATNCTDPKLHNPLNSLYLRQWLDNYFETINFTGKYPTSKEDNFTDVFLRNVRRDFPPPVPQQLTITKLQMVTALTLIADVGAGATPTVLGNGSVFIVPIAGLSVDYNPDYVQKIDISMNICANGDKGCNLGKESYELPWPIRKEQCRQYAILSPILSTVQPPSDYTGSHGPMRCSKTGEWIKLEDFRIKTDTRTQ